MLQNLLKNMKFDLISDLIRRKKDKGNFWIVALKVCSPQFKKFSLFEFPATDSLFVSHNHSSLELFGLFLRLFWPAPHAKTKKKCQGAMVIGYGETK